LDAQRDNNVARNALIKSQNKILFGHRTAHTFQFAVRCSSSLRRASSAVIDGDEAAISATWAEKEPCDKIKN
jgi:hypothetical protein